MSPRFVWHAARVGAAASVLVTLLSGCEPPPVDTVQRGYRGTGMVEVYHPATVKAAAALNAAPALSASAPADGPKAKEVYQNVKVLGDLSVAQFAGLMVDITNWVSPSQGCTYCHTANFAEDTLYTKVAARRMLQMTRHINSDWKAHVANTGVTCYTCHRGHNVPANTWYLSPQSDKAMTMLGNPAGQNAPSQMVGLTSLPSDVLNPYLLDAGAIRVVSTTALPEKAKADRASIKRTEATYGLMMHMSQSLGVNCTYCHNTRSFADWESSTPQRATAYHGIRMARDLNTEYIGSLANVLPASRKGPAGDVPKLNCATCHQGAYKPLYGADILGGNPGLTRPAAPAAVPVGMSTSTGAEASVTAQK